MLQLARSLASISGALVALGCHASLHAEVTIAASRARVWQVLTDFERYDEWNPFFVQAKGKAKVDTQLELTMQPVGKKPTHFSPKILVVRADRELVWRGRLGVPGLFDGRHSFVLHERGRQEVLLIQHEDFSGTLVSFVGYEPYRLGFERMNEALRRRALEGAEPPIERSGKTAWLEGAQPFQFSSLALPKEESLDPLDSCSPDFTACGRFWSQNPEFKRSFYSSRRPPKTPARQRK